MIGIINYGMGNLASVKNACEYMGIEAEVINEPAKLHNVDKIVLPGVGAFGMAMDNLNKSGFAHTIRELVIEKKKPILGICLGMQLLLDSSTEHGEHTGLGIVKGKVSFFGDVVKDLPIPHIGWNEVRYNSNATLYKNTEHLPSYYFVHSYYCSLAIQEQVAATTEYGINFHSSIENGHVFGCQFHPEKSQRNGLNIYKNFNEL